MPSRPETYLPRRTLNGISRRCMSRSADGGGICGAQSITTARCRMCWSRRSWNRRAALKLMRELRKRQGFAPRTPVTDKLRAYAATVRELGLTAWHHRAKWNNNRIESAHVPIRPRERKMQRLRSPGTAQKFLSIHAAPYNTFNTRRHVISASEHRQRRNEAFRRWHDVVEVAP